MCGNADDVLAPEREYNQACARAAALHGEVAWESEEFVKAIESNVMITGSSDPCSTLPNITVVESAEWDVWEVHKRARNLWVAITAWDRWHAADGIGPPELLRTEKVGRQIIHILRLLIERWGWRSIVAQDSEVLGKGCEPPGEVTGWETIVATELQALRLACAEFRYIIGYDHDPWFADAQAKLAVSDRSRPTSATVERLPGGPMPADTPEKVNQSHANGSAPPIRGSDKIVVGSALGTPLEPDATHDGVSNAQNNESKKMVRDKVFISYSHQDKRFLDDLQIHLKPNLRTGAITAWSDKQIAPGSKWFAEIEAALAETSVAVMLVSPNFLASDFIHEYELGPLLKEAEAGGVKILWVLMRDCSWKETPLKDYQAVAPTDKPFAGMTPAKRDTAWRKVCEAIRQAADTRIRQAADPCFMAGTEKTGDYVVVLHSPNGRIGYRDLEVSFRIRIEPGAAGRARLDPLLTRSHGWKQPGDQDQDRYSLVVQAEQFRDTLRYAIRALNPEERGTVVCPSAPGWAKQMVLEEGRKPARNPVPRESGNSSANAISKLEKVIPDLLGEIRRDLNSTGTDSVELLDFFRESRLVTARPLVGRNAHAVQHLRRSLSQNGYSRIKKKPLWREAVLMKESWVFNRQDIFRYFYGDHEDLAAKFKLLENHGMVSQVGFSDMTPIYRFSETLVECLKTYSSEMI